MRTGTIIAETSDLTIGYKSSGRASTIMEHLTLTARRGELVALIGRNGTGKSTLLRTMVALQPPLSGVARLSGIDILSSDRSSLPKVVSFASTEPFAVHNIKVREVVALGRFPYTNWIGTLTRADELSVNEALEATGILSLAERNIDAVSDGEKQRALIARSLAQDTELLVMDEPTAYLDLPSRYNIVSLLKKLTREKGKCVIYSTHDLDTAINEADKIWLMSERGVAEGAPEDLMLSKTIARAFESPLLSFSQTGGTFSFIRKRRGTVTLDAAGSLRKLTERALHRCGYRTEPDSVIR
ncbi:MAG: ABC transporter ATP-binding protein, partial [Bacteroidales bacterium]|nr:ABC transporter ATP-binding protein [Bacteroidales bacterium]